MTAKQSHDGSLRNDDEIPHRRELDEADDAVEVEEVVQATLALVTVLDHAEEKVSLLIVVLHRVLDDVQSVCLCAVDLEDTVGVARRGGDVIPPFECQLMHRSPRVVEEASSRLCLIEGVL